MSETTIPELSADYWAEQFDECYLDSNVVDGDQYAAVVKRLQEVLDMLHTMLKP